MAQWLLKFIEIKMSTETWTLISTSGKMTTNVVEQLFKFVQFQNNPWDCSGNQNGPCFRSSFVFKMGNKIRLANICLNQYTCFTESKSRALSSKNYMFIIVTVVAIVIRPFLFQGPDPVRGHTGAREAEIRTPVLWLTEDRWENGGF